MRFYRRYVDDIFIILEPHQDIKSITEEFNHAHSSIIFTSEVECSNMIHFLDVPLLRCPNGELERSVYRKPTWTDQYTNFHSFVPLRQKHNLVRCLSNRANKICSPSTFEAEQKFLKNVLRQNGYPDPFIERNMGGKEPPTMMYTAERKPIYICLPFKGEVASERVNRRLFRAIRSTFASATLKSWFTTSALFSLNLKDKVPSHDQSMVVYSFSCCCAAEYIGRTTRRLSQRIREHHPAWLRTGGNKSITSSVVAHLANTNHIVEPTRAFRVIYQAPLNQPKFIRQRILAAAESIAIRQRQPVLCLQKQFVQSLCLPWPQVTNVDLMQTQNTNHNSVT